MSQNPYKTRRILFLFSFVAVFTVMYHTSYPINIAITKTETEEKYEMKNVTNTKYKYKDSHLLPINLKNNERKLRNNIICGKNITCKTPINKEGFTNNFRNYKNETKELCPKIPPLLGPVPADKSIIGLYGIEKMYIDIVVGGIHTPPACIARHQAAIIVPLHETNRRMRKYLYSFLYYMHPFLMKQQLAYQIFVISKLHATTPYKRGELFNIGFEVAKAKCPEGWLCFIFHDPYLVPDDTRNLYRCGDRPKRLVADRRMPPRFGGAIAIKLEKFIKANGFSNLPWNDDDDYIDMYRRMITANISLETNIAPIGSYSSLSYLRQINNRTIQKKQTTPSLKSSREGLNNVKIRISSIEYHKLYTLVTVVE